MWGEISKPVREGQGPSGAVWPLVGRTSELAYVQRAFDGSVTGCLISGEAGVGKTRLLREAADGWRGRNGAVEWVSGTVAGQAILLGATAGLVARVFGISELHELLHETLTALEARSDKQPLALFVDDGHLLDDASALLVHLVAANRKIPCFVSVRVDQRAPDPIVALWKDGLMPRLDIGPLDRPRTMELLKTAVEDLSPATQTRLWDLSQGNPLLLRELVALAVDNAASGWLAGRLTISWRSDAAARLRELIDTRMGMLPPELLDPLELVSLGERLPVALAERLTRPEALEELERRSLITVTPGGDVCPAHPLHGEAVRGSMGALRRRSVLRTLAGGVKPSDGVDTIRVATWRLDAGDRDSRLFTTAANDALRRLDHPLAERLSRAAIEASDHSRAIGPALTLAAALMGQGRAGEAEDLLRSLTPVDDKTRAQIATTRATNLFRGLGRQDEALSVLETAEAKIREAAWLAECRSVRAMLLIIRLRADPALAIAAEILDDAETPEPARIRVVFATATVQMHRGDTQGALDLTATWLDRTRAWRRFAPLVEVQFGFVRFYTFLLAGRLLEARAYAEAGFELDHSHPPPAIAAVLAMARGAVAVAQGLGREGLDSLDAAASGLPGGDWFYNQEILRHSLTVRATLLSGEVERARKLLAQNKWSGAGSDLVSLYEHPLAQAWIDVADGRISSAVEGLSSAAEQTTDFSPLLAANLYHEVAGLGHGDSVAAPLSALARRLDNPTVDLCLRHVQSLLGGDPHSLSATSTRFEQLGNYLWAAEASTQAARAFEAASLRGAALAETERGARLLSRCGDPYSPALILAARNEGELLTRREREIAMLAAGGASNAELAAQLHVSVHTVHTHLTRIYRKLGVADRRELARYLAPRP